MKKIKDDNMEAQIQELSRQFPEETPIRRSKYIPDCLIGKTIVWKDGRQTITHTHELFPPGALQLCARSHSGDSTTASITARFWYETSRLTMLTVGMVCKFFTAGINKTIVHGTENLKNALSRPLDKPLLSIFNHNSCFDDPGLMGGILTFSQLADVKGMRWSVSATEVIFINSWVSKFFALGKVVPVTRGWGPQQPAMNFLVNRLNEGGWVNIFPEGKVIDTKSEDRYRWGVGRLVMEAKVSPIILPVYHVGMNTILPNPKEGEDQPVVVRPGNLVTVCIGEPIDLSGLREFYKSDSIERSWIGITSEIQRAMIELEAVTQKLHKQNIQRWIQCWHDSRDLYSYLLT